jgi:uncharacterized protein (TIGR03437 family)
VLQAQGTGSVTVTNYAGFTGSAPVAQGSIVSAYGSFGTVSATSAPTLNPMPRELAGLRVRIGNQDAPLYFVSSGQINFVVPVSTGSGRQTVQVISGGTTIASGNVLVWDIGPGLAVSDPAPGRMQGIIQNQDFAVNGENSRAKKGQVVSIYATGCGQTSPPLPDGAPPAALSRALATVEVYLANDKADVQFAGAHPAYPGICQINAVVPQKSYLTGQVPLYFTVNGMPSNQVALWVE